MWSYVLARTLCCIEIGPEHQNIATKKTYNTKDSLVETNPTTSLALKILCFRRRRVIKQGVFRNQNRAPLPLLIMLSVVEKTVRPALPQHRSVVMLQVRSQGLVFLRGMLNLDDWDGDLKLITDGEPAVQKDAAQSFREQTKTSLGRPVEHAKGMESRLGDIHQDIRDFISLQKDARREAACRRDLRVVDPQHDMERIEKSKDKLLDDAYKWILRTPEYAVFINLSDAGQCPTG